MDSLERRPEREIKYQYLSYQGTGTAAPLSKNPNCELIPNSLIRFMTDDTQSFFKSFLVDDRADYVVTKSCVRTTQLSAMKLDQKINLNFRVDEHYVPVFDTLFNMYRTALIQPFMTKEQVFTVLDLDKSPGFVELLRGYRTKRDCLCDSVDIEFRLPQFLDEEPIWKAVGKEELKLRSSYVDADKQRTFIIEPFGSLYHRKVVFGHQMEAIKGCAWSAYGLNPYEGGVNDLAHRMLKFPRFLMFDGKLWDRKFAHMREVQQVSSRHLPRTKQVEYVCRTACESLVLLPNGDLIWKDWSNNSGSGTTTRDNILGMSACLIHVLFKIADYLGTTYSYIEKHFVIFVFGDDVVASFDLDITDEKLREIFTSVFDGLYGITLDPFVISENLSDMQFLGFTFENFKQGWVPKYDVYRLVASLFGDSKRMDEEKELVKMYSLMLMSAGNGETVFKFFRDAIESAIIWSECDLAIKMRKLPNLGIPYFQEVVSFYLGLETSFDCEPFKEVGGIKDYYESQSTREITEEDFFYAETACRWASYCSSQ